MPKAESFIILEGYLQESMEFELLRGYERSHVPEKDRLIRKDNLITARLLDEERKSLVVSTPEVGFPTGCSAASSAPGFGLLQVVLPLHPEAVRIELQSYYNRILFSAPVSKTKPPALTLHLETRTDEGMIQFKIQPLADANNVEFFLVNASGRKLRTTPIVSEGIYSINLEPYVGHDFLRLCASVNQDFRTSETFSQPFKLPVGKIRGRILEPTNGSQWSAGMPGSLMGNLFYDSGKAISWDSTTSWAIDGVALNDSKQMAAYEELPPGEHTIELRHQPKGGNLVVLDRVQIQVLPETAEQKEYKALLAEYLDFKGKA